MEHKVTERASQQRLYLKFHRIWAKGEKGRLCIARAAAGEPFYDRVQVLLFAARYWVLHQMEYENTHSFHTEQELPSCLTYFFLGKVHVEFHRSALVQGVEPPERKTKKAHGIKLFLTKDTTRT